MERIGRNVPGRSRGERPQRPQRIQRIPRRTNRQIPRQNRRIIPKRDRLERVRNNRNIGRFRRFNNFRRRRINIPRRTIFVGRLPSQINDGVLHRLFRAEGNIISARVIKDFEGNSKGFGFVEFQNPRDAWRSIQKWNNTYLGGQIIRVHYPFRPKRFINNGINRRFAPRGRLGFRGRGRGNRGGRQINRGRRY